MSNYAWRITTDYYGEGEEGTNMNAVGIEGPRDATPEQLKAVKKGFKFRMLDDDGDVVYKGRLHVDGDIETPEAVQYSDYKSPVCSWPSVPEEAGFGPLNDYGTPNYGCTDIQYRCALPDGSLVWASL